MPIARHVAEKRNKIKAEDTKNSQRVGMMLLSNAPDELQFVGHIMESAPPGTNCDYFLLLTEPFLILLVAILFCIRLSENYIQEKIVPFFFF